MWDFYVRMIVWRGVCSYIPTLWHSKARTIQHLATEVQLSFGCFGRLQNVQLREFWEVPFGIFWVTPWQNTSVHQDALKGMDYPLMTVPNQTSSGWWFGTWMDYLSIQLGISSSHPNWRTHIFQRGRYNYHQPDHDVFRDFWNVSLLEDGTMAFHVVPLTHSSRVVQKRVKPPTCDPLTCGEYRWPLATKTYTLW